MSFMDKILDFLRLNDDDDDDYEFANEAYLDDDDYSNYEIPCVEGEELLMRSDLLKKIQM